MEENGFTLMELIIVAGIMVLLTGAGLAGFRSFDERQKLIQAARTFKNHLRTIQVASQTGTKPESGCNTLSGIEVAVINASTYQIATVCSNNASLNPKIQTLALGISFLTIPSPIQFLTLSQGVSPGTTTAICLTNGSQIYKVSVTPSGEIQDGGLVASCP